MEPAGLVARLGPALVCEGEAQQMLQLVSVPDWEVSFPPRQACLAACPAWLGLLGTESNVE